MRLFTFPFNISIFDCSEITSTFREDRQCLQKSCSAEQSVFEARKTLTCLQAIQQKNELQHRKNNNNDEKTGRFMTLWIFQVGIRLSLVIWRLVVNFATNNLCIFHWKPIIMADIVKAEDDISVCINIGRQKWMSHCFSDSLLMNG